MTDTLIARLRGIADWSRFAASLIEQAERGRALSPRQIEAAENTLAKVAARAEADAKRAAAPKPKVDISALEALFAKAQENGAKRPKFVSSFITISMAPPGGPNAGALYVKSDGDYQGKLKDGVFYAVRGADPAVAERVRFVAENPLRAAKIQGDTTGSCSFCSRELTDDRSVRAGWGPVCADKYGLPWGD